jgi:hypothetical protein
VDGIVTWMGQIGRFRFVVVDEKCNPPEAMALSRVSYVIGQGFAIYDALQITFTLTERGVDN